MSLLILPELGNDIIAISCVQTSHQLRDQMVVLGRFLNCRQLGTCDLALA